MIVGFTGTRRGCTPLQLEVGCKLIDSLFGQTGGIFLQGCCVGSDTQFAEYGSKYGWRVIGYPPTDGKLIPDHWRSLCGEAKWPQPYLVRNKAIVTDCTVMVATPGEMREVLRSGTWATIREAARQHKLCYIVYPDGRYENEASIHAQGVH